VALPNSIALCMDAWISCRVLHIMKTCTSRKIWWKYEDAFDVVVLLYLVLDFQVDHLSQLVQEK